MILIQDKIVTTPANFIEFTSIPQTFDHLILKCKMRVDTSATSWYNMQLLPNGLQPSNSVIQVMQYLADGGSPVAGEKEGPKGETNWFYGIGSTGTTGLFSHNQVHFYNYASTTTSKSASIDNLGWVSSTKHILGMQHWYTTQTAALTSLKILNPSAGNIIVGSRFSLYGIKAATPS